ncbi:MarR family winged helix-turn-helix transcriptional regulator [Propionispora hippei]|uniref:DNA-binding transcriptional regulator, MarR family n=1 Tax=Propionispora hippei DSM 15287 TaxID=1123003 RepID=A0A1M6EXX7_9FIRM|nr:MarR family transcriptional regulator [Propionispora hippei]SHI90292.1 DNA-binding transcriptional regulator, MarR family [Propionispora hippei DSM 15287]
MKQKEAELKELIGKIETLVYHVETLEGQEEVLLQAALAGQIDGRLQQIGLSLTECHVLDCMERHAGLNTTAIAKQMNMTKGGISKIAAKLIKKDLIEVRRLPDNQKEIYYNLTPLGKQAFGLHARLHRIARDQFTNQFGQYSPAELQTVKRFIDDLIAILPAVGQEGGLFQPDGRLYSSEGGEGK